MGLRSTGPNCSLSRREDPQVRARHVAQEVEHRVDRARVRDPHPEREDPTTMIHAKMISA
jgi:hypothetical protein